MKSSHSGLEFCKEKEGKVLIKNEIQKFIVTGIF
jgi:hypothetical protein